MDLYDLEDKFRALDLNTVSGDIPSLSYADMYHYLIEYVDSYSHNALKAYKLLEVYNFVVSEWIGDVIYLNISS